MDAAREGGGVGGALPAAEVGRRLKMITQFHLHCFSVFRLLHFLFHSPFLTLFLVSMYILRFFSLFCFDPLLFCLYLVYFSFKRRKKYAFEMAMMCVCVFLIINF